MPVMHPAEVWQRSGRWELMGEAMFRLKDRKGADLALGMTHEEIVATLATELSSYRELPQMWYQFQTKLRDEARPKAGLMRTREFTMKDSYSFDLDAAGLDKSFDLHRKAYARAFERLGIPAVPAEASNGTMGGSDSIEFICPSETGEDDIIVCPTGDYAANREKATSALPAVDPAVDAVAALPAPERFGTPGVRTIEDLAAGYDAPADRQIKTLVYVLDGKLTLVLAARRPRPGGAEARRRDRRGRDPPGGGRRDLRGARRPPRLARRGRGLGLPGHRRPRAAGPRRHDHRRQHRRRAPARRGRGAGHRRRAVGRPAHRAARGGVHPRRSAARGHQGHRGRAHLQARLQVLQRVRPVGAGARRQAGQADHGLVRHRRGARDGRDRRGAPRREGHRLARGGRAVRGRRGGRAAGRPRRRGDRRAGLPAGCRTPAST